jgi:assimilatory nitrate reductase catalytic subunit
VSITTAQARGHVFVPMHWTDVQASGGRGNRLPDQSVDPVSGQPGFKDNAARIEPLATAWRAFMLREDVITPAGLAWWCRSRIAGGWLYELADSGAIDVDALLPAGQRIEVADHAKGMRRLAVHDPAGRLTGTLHLTRTGTLPPREWLADQLGKTEAAPLELLAGRPSTPAPDRGPIVCVCHGIGRHQIGEAMRQGAQSVEAIGAATAAGTNCGSCRPAIAGLLREWNEQSTEAAA